MSRVDSCVVCNSAPSPPTKSDSLVSILMVRASASAVVASPVLARALESHAVAPVQANEFQGQGPVVMGGPGGAGMEAAFAAGHAQTAAADPNWAAEFQQGGGGGAAAMLAGPRAAAARGGMSTYFVQEWVWVGGWRVAGCGLRVHVRTCARVLSHLEHLRKISCHALDP